MRCDLLSH
uniref:Uncharacterized protein n=1 Tax=Anguilla anguilla TaxID=7936 RepID=A0A0E9SAH3_ANGAN